MYRLYFVLSAFLAMWVAHQLHCRTAYVSIYHQTVAAIAVEEHPIFYWGLMLFESAVVIGLLVAGVKSM